MSHDELGKRSASVAVDLERRRAVCARIARQRALDLALAEVARAFAEREVRFLLLKGPVIARWLYDDPGERSYIDIDLLVSPEQFQTAEQQLTEIGFECLTTDWDRDERSHHDVWRRTAGWTVAVELHRTLVLLPPESSLVWERLSQTSRSIEVAGERVAVPSEVSCTLIVALHAAQHSHGWPRSMEDLHRALARVDLETWRAAAAVASELGAGEAFAAGLALNPRGRQLAEQLGLGGAGGTRLLRLLEREPPPGALGIEQLASSHGARARVRLIARKIVPSRGRIRAWLPVASRGRWGLCVAYLYRPFWLAAKLPRGLQVWLSVSMRRSGTSPTARRRVGGRRSDRV